MPNTRRVRAGEIIIREGDEGSEGYLIVSGAVEVHKAAPGGDLPLAVLGKNDVFGEMAMIDEKPRSASVVALEDCELLVVTRERFVEVMRERPEALVPYLRSLFERLRVANQLAAEALAPAAADAQPAARDARSPAEPARAADALLTARVRVSIDAATEELRQAIDRDHLAITRFPFRVGRPSTLGALDIFTSNDLHVRDEAPFIVSRNHFAIDAQGGRLVVIDRGSRLGTVVNGRPIGLTDGPTSAPLRVGDNQIVVGPARSPYVFRVRVDSA